MKKIKLKFLRAPENDIALRIYAVILAILIWFVMSITLYPTIYRTIENVPVSIDIKGTIAEDYSLSAANFKSQKVSVRIKGMRYEIGNYTAEDLKATLVVNGVNKAGEYELDVKVEAKTGENFDVISISPSKIKVKFDSIIEKEFATTPEAPNVKASSGYIMETPICVPSTVKISGPKQDIERITKVVVRTDAPAELTESQSIADTNLILYAGDTILDDSFFTIINDKISIEVPIYMKKTLPFKLEIQNYPRNFDLSSLKYTLTPSTIEIAAPNALIENLGEIHLGYLDLRKIDLDSMNEIAVTLESGYKNLSGFERVIAKFNTENYSSKLISIGKSQIHVINAPLKYEASVQTTGISNIKIIGPKEIIDKITSDDIIAEVDLLHSDINEATYNAPISIYSPAYNTVWAYGSYNVSLGLTQKTINEN